MRENWLAELYQTIKKTHTDQLSRAMSILQRKAARDPEIEQVLHLLYPWASGQEQEEKPHADGTCPE